MKPNFASRRRHIVWAGAVILIVIVSITCTRDWWTSRKLKTWLATVPIHEADYRIKSIDRGPLNRFDHPATVLDTLFAALVLGPNSNQADQALLDAVVGLWPIWDELGITHAEWEDELTAFIKRLDMNNGSPKEAKAIQYIHELFEQRTEAGYRSRNAHGN